MYNMRVSICALELFSTFTHGFSQSNIESFVVIIIINNFFTPFFHLKILFEQLFNFAIVISRSFFSGKENWPTGCANEDGDIYDEFQTVDINEESNEASQIDIAKKERFRSIAILVLPPPLFIANEFSRRTSAVDSSMVNCSTNENE